MKNQPPILVEVTNPQTQITQSSHFENLYNSSDPIETGAFRKFVRTALQDAGHKVQDTVQKINFFGDIDGWIKLEIIYGASNNDHQKFLWHSVSGKILMIDDLY